MKRIALGAAMTIVAFVQCCPAMAQQRDAADPCKVQRKKSGFGKFLGDLGTDAVGSALQKTGIRINPGTRNTLNAALVDLFACKLRPEEREKAAGATEKVVGKPVGATETWSSPTRPGVTGSTQVVAQNKLPDGTVCKDVRDVATIDGEETTVVKTMCRAPGESGFTLQQKNA